MKNLETEKKWFGFYKIFPKIYAIVTLVLSIIWSIIDSNAHVTSLHYVIGDSKVTIFWGLIGVIITALSYISLKITFSPMILQTEYLEVIAQNSENITNITAPIQPQDSPLKQLMTYKQMMDNGLMTKEDFEKKKAQLFYKQ